MEHVTTSEEKCFKVCRKKYGFKYLEMLKPRRSAEPLYLGTTYHKLVEEMLTKDQIAGEEKAREMKKSCEFMEHELLVDTAEIMADHFYKHAGELFLDDCEIISLEQEFEVQVGVYGHRMNGMMDGLLRFRNGDCVILEHKTTKNYNEKYEANLLFEDQATNYIIAAKKMGYNVVGVLYVIIEKFGSKQKLATPMANRKYRKDGKLIASQRAVDETNIEYLRRMQEWYNEACRVHTKLIYRTIEQLEEKEAQLKVIYKEMREAKKDPSKLYRNPAACSQMKCEFDGICLEDNEEIRRINFEKKNSRHEELEVCF